MFSYRNIPQLDLHGLDRDYAAILINEFIADNYKIANKYIRIVHGNGQGILRKTTQEVLKRNKYVKEFKLDMFNNGSTMVELIEKH